MKIRTKLGLLLFGLSAAVVAMVAVLTSVQVEKFFRQRILDELENKIQEAEFLARSRTEALNQYEKLQQFAHSAEIRLTLIAEDGTVIFESDKHESELHSLENHLYRPEIQDALRNGTGTSQRHSTTVNADMLYLAEKLRDPFSQNVIFSSAAIVRVGIPLTEVQHTLSDLRSKILIVGVAVLFLVSIVTVILSRQVTQPIAEMAKVAEQIRLGDFAQRIAVHANDELGALASTLNSMIEKLDADIAQLKKLERVRSEFLGNVSHELRTPLFALQTAIETLLHGAIDDPTVNKDFLQKALHHTERLDELMCDLIEISSIESGEMKMSFRYFDLKELLHQSVDEMRLQVEKKNIALTILDGDGNLEAYGDKERLKQVIINLLTNAIKFTDAGGTVKLSSMEANGKIQVSVQDTGCGIAPEHLTRIFERFYKVDKDRSREIVGTGLGLSIVKHIVEAHGSKVEVQSEPGEGSTFSFTLKQ